MIYRTEKGSPLSIEELDNNFREIILRLNLLENEAKQKCLVPEGVSKIEQKGDEIHFVSTFGKVMGTATLPRVIPHLRGYWGKDHYYNVFDFVVHDHKTYGCIKAHVANDFEKDENEFWKIFMENKEL